MLQVGQTGEEACRGDSYPQCCPTQGLQPEGRSEDHHQHCGKFNTALTTLATPPSLHMHMYLIKMPYIRIMISFEWLKLSTYMYSMLYLYTLYSTCKISCTKLPAFIMRSAIPPVPVHVGIKNIYVATTSACTYMYTSVG